jgi:3-deoxy-D-manno-octulosonic-acid transferase
MPVSSLAMVVLGLAALCSGGLAAAAWLAVLRPDLLARCLGLVERRSPVRPGILFYAASHGELLLLERLLPLLAAEQPEAELIVLVPRLSVEKVALERLPKFRVQCLCPLVPWGMATALRRLAADLFVVVEFARIPLWVRAARGLGIPLILVNGRLSEKNRRRCRDWRWLLTPMLRAFDHILVQTPDDAEDFLAAGALPGAIEVAGPLKYDAASYNRNTFATRRLGRLAQIGEDELVLLAGSTREGEEAVLASIFKRLADDYPRLRLIIVPRNHHRFDEVAQLLAKRGIGFQRRSELEGTGDRRQATGERREGTRDARREPAAGFAASARVLLVDTVGELAAWWGTAHIGFVGASLTSRGGQNMIEPAALGVATCFGPHTSNFRDVVELLLAADAAVEVASDEDLEAFVRRCLDEPAYAAALGQRAQAVCRQQTGAMVRTCERLSMMLAERGGPAIVKMPEPAARPRRRAA